MRPQRPVTFGPHTNNLQPFVTLSKQSLCGSLELRLHLSFFEITVFLCWQVTSRPPIPRLRLDGPRGDVLREPGPRLARLRGCREQVPRVPETAGDGHAPKRVFTREREWPGAFELERAG